MKTDNNVQQNVIVIDSKDQLCVPFFFDGAKQWKAYLGDILNQGECGACYAFATTSVLQDRYHMFTDNILKPILNPLEALVCHPTDLTKLEHRLLQFDSDFRKESENKTQFSACRGGSLSEIARFLYRLGAVESSCIKQSSIQNYIDQNNRLPICNNLTSQRQTCANVTQVKKYWPILDFYVVSESNNLIEIGEKMKYDICHNGPMIAGFKMYQDFIDDYDGTTVYIPNSNQSFVFGHAIKIIGWGTTIQNGVSIDYWQCVNSWGSNWGLNGLFKLQRANLLLETEFNHISVIPQVPGILRYFRFFERKTDVDELDQNLRRINNVNPFTLLSEEGTKYSLENNIPISLVFNQLSYPITTKFCCTKILKLNQTIFILLSIILSCFLIFWILFYFLKKKYIQIK